jgi:arabinose-5-phosphate isomerase
VAGINLAGIAWDGSGGYNPPTFSASIPPPQVKDDDSMSTEAAAKSTLLSPFEQLRLAREILQQESRTLTQMAKRLDSRFCQAVDYLYHCRGSVIVSGMGKAGLVGQKIMATLASTGTRSHFLHPAEAVHGDLGRVHSDDVVLILSQSGETEEVVRILPSLRDAGATIIAITARVQSTLGRATNVVLELGPLEEACPLGLAPSTSTTAMLALGDALALVTSRMRGFRPEDYARFHPGGSLGRKLSKVEDHMRPLDRCRVASQWETVREVFMGLSVPGRRSGAIMLLDSAGMLSGLFTDSDLARLFEHRRDGELDEPIRQVMTREPIRVVLGSMMVDAVAVMAERRISELPVTDAEGRPVGLIDVTDVMGMLPRDTAVESSCDMPSSLPDQGPAPHWRILHAPHEDRPT